MGLEIINKEDVEFVKLFIAWSIRAYTIDRLHLLDREDLKTNKDEIAEQILGEMIEMFEVTTDGVPQISKD